MAIVKQGSTILNAGAKGDKGDAGSGSLSNGFVATSIADLQNVANLGKVASIESEIDLGTATLTLQKNMIIQFNGGSFTNGAIVWDYNPIEASPYTQIFSSSVTHTGLAHAQYIYPEWFGVVADGTNSITTINKKGVSYMRLCKNGTYVFSNTTATYMVDISTDNTDYVDTDRPTGIEYAADDTTLKILKGVTIKGIDTVQGFYAVVALYGKNITVNGGGKISGCYDYNISENGVSIMAYLDSDNFIIDDIELTKSADGFAPMPAFNYEASWTDRPESFELGNLDASGNNTASTTAIRSKTRQTLGAKALELGFTILQNGSYQSYPVLDNGTKGRYDIYFYDALTSGNFLGRVINQSMYERVYYPTGTTHVQVVLHTVGTTLIGTLNSTYNSELSGVLKSLDMQFRPSQFPVGGVIKNCDIHNNARNGISVTSIQGLHILNNKIHDQFGNGILESAIDFEEGYYLNRRHIVEGNTMYNNGTIDIATLRISDVKIINNFFKRADNLEPNKIKMSADFAENFIVTGNTFDGGSLTIKSGIYDNNVLTDMKVQIKAGTLMGSEIFNSEIEIDAEGDILLKDLIFNNNNDKAYGDATYSIIGADGQVSELGTVLDAAVGSVNVYPQVVLENITINGQPDTAKTIQLLCRNSYWRNIHVNTTIDDGAIITMAAKEINGFYHDGTLGIEDLGAASRFRNLDIRGFYLNSDFNELDIRDSNFYTAVYDRDVFRMPTGRVLNKITIKDNNFSFGSNTTSTRILANNGTVNDLRFEGNEVTYPTVNANVFTLSGTNTGYFIYKNNIITGATFNTEVGDITNSNVVDGVEIP